MICPKCGKEMNYEAPVCNECMNAPVGDRKFGMKKGIMALVFSIVASFLGGMSAGFPMAMRDIISSGKTFVSGGKELLTTLTIVCAILAVAAAAVAIFMAVMGLMGALKHKKETGVLPVVTIVLSALGAFYTLSALLAALIGVVMLLGL